MSEEEPASEHVIAPSVPTEKTALDSSNTSSQINQGSQKQRSPPNQSKSRPTFKVLKVSPEKEISTGGKMNGTSNSSNGSGGANPVAPSGQPQQPSSARYTSSGAPQPPNPGPQSGVSNHHPPPSASGQHRSSAHHGTSRYHFHFNEKIFIS
ncbi:hypothetical protein WR25_19143 [Diploscapter pachys]|uniref:Uncharacterized protein n=1 Tax=Diploscapter pachys TaxID=2018661 RepID=A0A2A2KPS1_9BILA|nr:hypothetical protein WR25_19143 [Diploscapter pachys]